MNAIGAKSMADIGDLYKSYDVVAIDEGQFFPDVSIFTDNQFKIVSWSDQAANEGKLVIISALDGTFQRTGFECILQLIPRAEKVKKLLAIFKNCN